MQITLKAARVNAGISQTKAAEAVNVDRCTISNWERGKSFPDVVSCRKLCDLYGVSMDAVIFSPSRST